MPYQPFSFTNAPASSDQTAQAGLNQYVQQGQSMMNPGQAQVQQSDPLLAAGSQGLAKAFQQSQQNAPQLSAQSQLPIAPGIYQSSQALDAATGPMYASPYQAEQAQPMWRKLANALSGGA